MCMKLDKSGSLDSGRQKDVGSSAVFCRNDLHLARPVLENPAMPL